MENLKIIVYFGVTLQSIILKWFDSVDQNRFRPNKSIISVVIQALVRMNKIEERG